MMEASYSKADDGSHISSRYERHLGKKVLMGRSSLKKSITKDSHVGNV